MSELGKIAKAMGPGPATYPKGDLERVPGKQKWVDRAGGLPRYIERIASHLHNEKGMSIGHAIATAVNAVKKMCASGDLNYSGKQNVNAGSRAAACAAVAEWEKKKASARVSKGVLGRKWSDDEFIAFLTFDQGISFVHKCGPAKPDCGCSDEERAEHERIHAAKKRKKKKVVAKRGFNPRQPRSPKTGQWIKGALSRLSGDEKDYPKLAQRLARANKEEKKNRRDPDYEPYTPPKKKKSEPKRKPASNKKAPIDSYKEQMERIQRMQEEERKNRREAEPKKKRDRSGRGLGPKVTRTNTDKKPEKGDPVPGKPGVTDGGYDSKGHKLPDSDGVIRLRRGDTASLVRKISEDEFNSIIDEFDADAEEIDADVFEFAAEGEIEKSDDDKRLVFGWCSIAKHKDGTVEVDKQGDVLEDIDQMEKVAYDFVLHSRDGGEMHVRKGVSTLVESFVSTPEKWAAMEIPEGTLPVGWWVGFKVHDEEVWKGVKSGKYKMFSVHGSVMRKALEDA